MNYDSLDLFETFDSRLVWLYLTMAVTSLISPFVAYIAFSVVASLAIGEDIANRMERGSE